MVNWILFDLDDTLYPASVGLMQAIKDRMNEFMITRLGIPAAEVNRIRHDYWERYGTTLRGLYLERHIDPQAFLNFVHSVPIRTFLQPDIRLGAMLAQLPQEKDIFTNAPAKYAQEILSALGIEKYFTRIFDINFIEYESKPAPAAYAKVLSALAAPAERCVMVDDTARNLLPAQKLGMRTVLVKGNPLNDNEMGADVVIETLYDLAETLLVLKPS